MKISPIWKDVYYTTGKSTLNYRIETSDGEIVYSGRAYKYPDAQLLSININKICQNYLSQSISDIIEGKVITMDSTDAVVNFNLINTDTDTVIQTYQFIYDWSYDRTVPYGASEGEVVEEIEMSKPITHKYSPNMYKFHSYLIPDADHEQGYFYVTTDADWDEWYDDESCEGDYALYYVNAYGGWDSLLLESFTSTKKDDMTKHYINKAFDNNTKEFEESVYISEVSTTYNVGTGLLTEEQAKIFAQNCLTSNQVYLHDLNEDRIIPVVITDNNVTYKNKHNSVKGIYYRINLKESQTKIKR